MARKVRVGELRPSQLLHTYGVGAVVDLPYISAIVMGLEDWDTLQAKRIVEERVLAAVKAQLGAQVDALFAPPAPPEDSAPFGTDADAKPIGVPVGTFPRYMRCPLCERLGPRTPGIFDLKPDPYRPERTRYVHSNCQRALSAKNPPPVVPARFLTACAHGHLDEFPWNRFVHEEVKDCQGDLRLTDRGASGEASDIYLKCLVCGKARSMAQAFGEEGLKDYKCRGRRPHLRDFDDQECTERLRAILLGASNSWFPVTVSALYVPPSAKDELAGLVEDAWDKLSAVDTIEVLAFLRKLAQLGPLAKFADAAIFQAIKERKDGTVDGGPTNLKGPEWKVFSAPKAAPRAADFRLNEVAVPRGHEASLTRVVLVERLRVVMALTGFTRIESPLDFEDAHLRGSDHRAPLSRKPPPFVPASEVRGEGIFLQFREDAVATWCAQAADHGDRFFAAHKVWRAARKIKPVDAGFPEIRFVLLHSFAHTLMRQLAIECGYAAASIRERIYSANPEAEGGPMAGVLLYTAAPDSEGTLGGLVSLGTPESLGRHIDQALEQARLCSSDPLCAEHIPGAGGPTKLHAAACHACLFAPETSCERGNKYLDRSVLVATLGGGATPFFAER
jgi:hypothetical protein